MIIEGIVVSRSVIVVVGRCPGRLNDLWETTMGVVRLVMMVGVIRVVVVPSGRIR